jgi:hypothetical protein
MATSRPTRTSPRLTIYDVLTRRLMLLAQRDPLTLNRVIGDIERRLDRLGIPNFDCTGRELARR